MAITGGMMKPKWLNRWQAMLIVVLALITIGVARGQVARSAPQATWQIVWKIGTFDQSSAEFNSGVATTPVAPYIVGKSVPNKNWFAFQPGSTNGPFGHQPHPVSIQFNLAEKPRGVYQMKVALLVEHPRISTLDIAINGYTGRFYQHPKLNYNMGDISGAFSPEYSADTISFEFPARYLLQATNKIVLTAIDEPSPGDQPTADGTPAGDSGVVYDALELEQRPAGRFEARQVSASTVPTIFYQNQDGQLQEIVNVYVRYNEQPRNGTVELEIKGKTFRQDLPTDRTFGEQKAQFAVPEFASATQGKASVAINGHRQSFSQELTPGKKWTFFVVPNEHLDLGYTDYQAKVAEVHARVLDEAMELIRKHPDFRYSVDGYWDVQQFMDGRSAEEKQKLEKMIANCKIFIPAQYASLLTGFPTAETLIRSLYPSYRFSREHNTPFDYASITDVPSYTWSYASVLAAAGLKYFVAASDNYRGPILVLGHLNERTPFWWQGPDGSKILMWYSRHYHQMLTLFGMPPQVAAGHDSLPVFLQMYEHPGYKSDAVLLYGTQPENQDLFPQQAALVDEWNKIYAYPKLEYSGFEKAMSYITRQFGNDIPTISGDGGPYWEDGIASDAYYAAIERENESRALTAEKFSTISSIANSRIVPDQDKLRRMWRNMVLMDEHTWTSYESISNPQSKESVEQLKVKDSRATRALSLLDNVLRRSMGSLADSISAPRGTLLVFNALNWQRSALVEFDLPNGRELVDKSTNQPVPVEVLSAGKDYHRVRFMAADVPAVGYKAYTLKETGLNPPAPQQATVSTLESPYYKVELDPQSGAVRSIFDKQLNKELVNAASPYRFDQYVYVTGADHLPNRLVQYRTVSPIPHLTFHPAADGRLVSVFKTPFGTEARMVSTATNTPRIETTILLFNNQKKIEFINHIQKKKVFTKEGVYFAFPFAMSNPEFHYEIQNGDVNPAKDMLPGAGLEWFSVQHWVSLDQSGVSATVLPLDAPMVTLGDIARGSWPTEFGKRKGTIFSYVMNNYWDTNYRGGQGRNFTFRYVVTSDTATNPTDLSRLGWKEMTPLEINEIVSQDKAINAPRPLNGAENSFISVSDRNVLLDTWKQAQDGDGTIMRFLNLDGQPGEVRVATPLLDIKSAWLCNAMEANQQQVSGVSEHGFAFNIKPHQIITVRITGSPTISPPTL
jgi:alpha-mannosidase